MMKIKPISMELSDSMKHHLDVVESLTTLMEQINFNVPKEFLGEKETNNISVTNLRINNRLH